MHRLTSAISLTARAKRAGLEQTELRVNCFSISFDLALAKLGCAARTERIDDEQPRSSTPRDTSLLVAPNFIIILITFIICIILNFIPPPLLQRRPCRQRRKHRREEGRDIVGLLSFPSRHHNLTPHLLRVLVRAHLLQVSHSSGELPQMVIPVQRGVGVAGFGDDALFPGFEADGEGCEGAEV